MKLLEGILWYSRYNSEFYKKNHLTSPALPNTLNLSKIVSMNLQTHDMLFSLHSTTDIRIFSVAQT